MVIGGGYATGRELIEFFLPLGALGGSLGILFAGLVFGVVLAIAFEFARIFKAYDYRSFCRNLLGRFWIAFECAYFALIVLVLSVISAASSELVSSLLGLPTLIGTILLVAPIAAFTFFGSEAIARALAGWSVLLYLTYAALFGLSFWMFGERIENAFASQPVGENWALNGLRYASYNLAIIPVVLFSIVGLQSRRETIGAGLIAGGLAVIPALLFFAAMMAHYPAIGREPVPATYLMAALNVAWLNTLFHLVLFGTFVETGIGLLHAVNERLSANIAERGKTMPRYVRPIVSLAILFVSIYAATTIGIVDLIARGYGALTYVFIFVLIGPLLTIGLWRIVRH